MLTTLLAATEDLTVPSIDYDPTVNDIAAVVLVAWGLLNVLLGYKLFRWIVVLYSGIAVFLLSGMLLLAYVEQPVIALVGAIVGGIVAGVLGWYLYYLIVFFFGMGLGTVVTILVGGQFLPKLSNELAAQAGQSAAGVNPIFLIGALAVGVVCGIVALLVHRPLIIIYTSIYGAIAVILGTFDLLDRTTPLMIVQEDIITQQVGRFQDTTLLIAVMAVAAIGVFMQFTVTGKERKGKLMGESREKKNSSTKTS